MSYNRMTVCDIESVDAKLAEAKLCLAPLVKQLEQIDAHFRANHYTAADAQAWAATMGAMDNVTELRALILRAQKLLLEQHPERAE